MLLNYDIKYNVTSTLLLEYLRDFLVSRGWTIDYDLPNTSWRWTGSTYDFVSVPVNEGEYNLAFHSHGYGSQSLFYKMYLWNFLTPGYSNNVSGRIEGFNDATYTNTNVHPVQQTLTKWTLSQIGYFNTAPTIPKVYFLGNDKYVMMVLNPSSSYCQFIHFGSIELFDSSENEGNITSNLFYTYMYDWQAMNETSSLDNLLAIKWNDIQSTATNLNINFYGNAITKNLDQGCGLAYWRLFRYANTYSDVAPIAQPTVYVKDTDNIFFPLGFMPFYRINTTNLTLGQIVQYGNDDYIVFPNCRVSYVSGAAFKIA